MLAVAHAWAALTAQGGTGLTPQEALVNLRARAGQELDPVVVAAAVKTVDDEIIELGPADAQPAPAAIAASTGYRLRPASASSSSTSCSKPLHAKAVSSEASSARSARGF